jgi:hypothetical protein
LHLRIYVGDSDFEQLVPLEAQHFAGLVVGEDEAPGIRSQDHKGVVGPIHQVLEEL